jgi:hypothetical protein
MKRYFYIGAFMLLGFLVSMLVHAGIEIPTLALVTGEAGKNGDNIIWQHWNVIHGTFGIALSLGGILLGFFLGRRFWQILYVEKRYGTPRW